MSKNPNIRIAIVGYGDDDAWVKSELSGLSNNVYLAGKVPFNEMVSYYNRSHVYASTSYYEGLPGTCLEAMAMQLPVVVWDFLFYQDLVRDGENGLVVSPNDFEGMSNRVLELLSNSKQSIAMGLNGRKILENNYSWQKLSIDVLGVFK